MTSRKFEDFLALRCYKSVNPLPPYLRDVIYEQPLKALKVFVQGGFSHPLKTVRLSGFSVLGMKANSFKRPFINYLTQ